MLRFFGAASEQPAPPPIPPPVQSVSPQIPSSSRQRVPTSSPTSSRVPISSPSEVGVLKSEIGRLSQQVRFLQEQQATKDVSRDLLLEQLQDSLMRVRREREQEVRESGHLRQQGVTHRDQGPLLLHDRPNDESREDSDLPGYRAQSSGRAMSQFSRLSKQDSLLLLEAMTSRSKLRVAKASLAPSPRQYIGASAAVCRGLLSQGSRRRATYSPPDLHSRHDQEKLPVARILGLGEEQGEESQMSTLPVPPPSSRATSLGTTSSPKSACIDRIEEERIQIGSLLGRVHDNRARLMTQASEAGARLERLEQENTNLRAGLLEARARSVIQISKEEAEIQTDPVPSAVEIELSTLLVAKESEVVALQAKLKGYQSMLEEAQGEIEEMQVNARSLKQMLDKSEAKLSVSQSRHVKARRSSTAQRSIQDPSCTSQRSIQDPSCTSREGTLRLSGPDRSLTPTKRARGDEEQEATRARMDEIQLLLGSIVEEKEKLKAAHEAQIRSMEQRHEKDLSDLRAIADASEANLLSSEEKRAATESFLHQLKGEYQRLLTDHDSLRQQLGERNKVQERSDGGSAFYSAGQQSQGGEGSGGGSAGGTEYDSIREGESLGGGSLGGGGSLEAFYPKVCDKGNALVGQSTLNPLFFHGEEEKEEEEGGALEEGDPSDFPLPLSEAPAFLLPIESVTIEGGGLSLGRSLDYEAVSSSLNNPLFDSRRSTEVLTPALDPGKVEDKVDEVGVFDPAFTFSRNSSCFDEEVLPSFNLTASARKQRQEEEEAMASRRGATGGVLGPSPDPTLMTDEEIVAYSKSLTSRILNEVHSLAGQLEAVRSSPFAPAAPSPPPTHRYPGDPRDAAGSSLSGALGRLKEHLSGLQRQNRVGREEGSEDWGSVDASGSLAGVDQGPVAASPWKSPAWPVSKTPVADRRFAAQGATGAFETTRTMRPLVFDSPI